MKVYHSQHKTGTQKYLFQSLFSDFLYLFIDSRDLTGFLLSVVEKGSASESPNGDWK
jgi:hypothetical protein